MGRAARLLLLFLTLALAGPGRADIVTSAEVSDVSVTIYRDPNRDAGMMDAGWPGGYALITETRTITLPAGEHHVRFENVAEGLLPETAIITGLPKGVKEKNRDARLISPAGLVDAFLKRQVRIRRTDPATGKISDEDAIIQTGPNGGVILKTSEGLEALHCSGLPERMTFGGVPETLTARPTLSVLTRSDKRVTATIRLTYMAQGFDWSANYVANMAKDSSKLNLFAWLTVANGGQQNFPNARLMVVGGKPNKTRNNPPPRPPKSSLDLKCWPMDTTSTHPAKQWYRMPMPAMANLERFNYVGRNPAGTYVSKKDRRKMARMDKGAARGYSAFAPAPPPPAPEPAMMQEAPISVSAISADQIVVMGSRISAAEGTMAQQEELGDLKLYRVPMRVNVAAQSQKQVAMLDRPGAAFRRIYLANVASGGPAPQTMGFVLRAKNVKEDGLGLALPAGSLALFEPVANRPLLVGEHAMEDLAIGQEVELQLGQSPDVQWTLRRVSETDSKQGWEVTVTNARPVPIRAEIIVPYDFAKRDPNLERGNGGWRLPVDVPANGTASVRYVLKTD
jgi:hypothetical protein